MSTLQAASQSERVYQFIHKSLNGQELNSGEAISEVALAQKLGVSRTPVREAIRRLQTEGVIEQIPRFGTFIKAPTLAEFREHFSLRRTLEMHAASLAARRRRSADLALMARACAGLRAIARKLRRQPSNQIDPAVVKSVLSLDAGFHEALAGAAHSPELLRMLKHLRVMTHLSQSMRRYPPASLRRTVVLTCRDHLRIARAVRHRDARAARRLVAAHLSVRAMFKQAAAADGTTH